MSRVSQIYRFNGMSLDTAGRALLRDGRQVEIEPKAFELLHYLLAHRDRAVGKNELQDRIWSGTIVTEAALARCVMKVRKAIGDENKPYRVIRTVQRFGYRFIADVEPAPGVEEAAAKSLPLPAKPSIAVLPFRNVSGDPEQKWFCEGITDDVVTELSRFHSLFVIASHSSYAVQDQRVSLREAGARLGVAYLLDGSLQRSENRLRLIARLIDTESNKQIWAERYDREVEDVFLLQEELARTIAATIGGRVDATRARARASPGNLAAYDLVIRAQALYYQVTPGSVREAIGLLDRAIEIDPASARSYALLAACHSIESWSYWSEDPELSMRLALAHGRRALELDDTDSLSHALYGEILLDNDQAQLAEVHFRKSIALNPNDIAGRTLYASLLAATGRSGEGLEQIAMAERLDPYGLAWIPWIKLTVLFSAGRDAECITAGQQLNPLPNEARLWLAAAHERLGQRSDALAVLARFLDTAAIEMPTFPGRKMDAWEPFLNRYLGLKHRADHDVIVRLLEKIWPPA
jgi:TolB-like protein/Tfp pilus assembly protein PilF